MKYVARTLAQRIEAYLDDAPGCGGHSDLAGGSAYDLLRDTLEELHGVAQASLMPHADVTVLADEIDAHVSHNSDLELSTLHLKPRTSQAWYRLLKALRATPTLASIQAAADEVVSRINEWDDRTSPDDFPEALLVTSSELHRELMRFAEDIGACSVPSTHQRSAVKSNPVTQAERDIINAAVIPPAPEADAWDRKRPGSDGSPVPSTNREAGSG